MLVSGLVLYLSTPSTLISSRSIAWQRSLRGESLVEPEPAGDLVLDLPFGRGRGARHGDLVVVVIRRTDKRNAKPRARPFGPWLAVPFPRN